LQGDIKLILREINPLNEKKIKFKKIDDEHHGTGIEFLDIESAQEIKKTLEK
jgi:hypothetical protein